MKNLHILFFSNILLPWKKHVRYVYLLCISTVGYLFSSYGLDCVSVSWQVLSPKWKYHTLLANDNHKTEVDTMMPRKASQRTKWERRQFSLLFQFPKTPFWRRREDMPTDQIDRIFSLFPENQMSIFFDCYLIYICKMSPRRKTLFQI